MKILGVRSVLLRHARVRAPETQFGWQESGMMHTRQETRNLELKAITDKNGPGVAIALPFLAPNAAGAEGGGCDKDWDPQHLQKIYNGKKAALKERYWVPNPEDGTYDVERIRLQRPSHNSEMETSATREYPSLIHTFFLTHTVGGVFLNPEDKSLYGLGSNTPTGVPYTNDEIMAIIRGGKQRGHIPSVGRVLPRRGTVIPPPSQSTHSADIARLKKREKRLTKQVNMFMRLFRSDDKFSQMLNQLESQPEYGGGSGSSGCGDDEPGDDEDDGEDEEDEDDS
ncbi:hypothetical protein Tco_1225041 [Tanacetum coccineum]